MLARQSPLSYHNGTLYSYNWRDLTFRTNTTTSFVTTDPDLQQGSSTSLWSGDAKSAITYVNGGVHIFEHNSQNVRKVTFGSATTNGSFTTLGNMSSLLRDTNRNRSYNCAMAWDGAYIYIIHGEHLFRMDEDTGDATYVAELSSASTGALFGRQQANQYDMTFKPA